MFGVFCGGSAEDRFAPLRVRAAGDCERNGAGESAMAALATGGPVQPHRATAMRSNSCNAAAIFPASDPGGVRNVARVKAPFAASRTTLASVRFVAALTRAVSRSNRPRNSRRSPPLSGGFSGTPFVSVSRGGGRLVRAGFAFQHLEQSAQRRPVWDVIDGIARQVHFPAQF